MALHGSAWLCMAPRASSRFRALFHPSMLLPASSHAVSTYCFGTNAPLGPGRSPITAAGFMHLATIHSSADPHTPGCCSVLVRPGSETKNSQPSKPQVPITYIAHSHCSREFTGDTSSLLWETTPGLVSRPPGVPMPSTQAGKKGKSMAGFFSRLSL
jgi:hypothetical protein